MLVSIATTYHYLHAILPHYDTEPFTITLTHLRRVAFTYIESIHTFADYRHWYMRSNTSDWEL